MIRSRLQSAAGVKWRVYLASVYFLPITVFVFIPVFFFFFFLQQPPLGLFKQAMELMKCMKRRKRGWDREGKLSEEGWCFRKSTRLHSLEGPVGVCLPPSTAVSDLCFCPSPDLEFLLNYSAFTCFWNHGDYGEAWSYDIWNWWLVKNLCHCSEQSSRHRHC